MPTCSCTASIDRGARTHGNISGTSSRTHSAATVRSYSLCALLASKLSFTPSSLRSNSTKTDLCISSAPLLAPMECSRGPTAAATRAWKTRPTALETSRRWMTPSAKGRTLSGSSLSAASTLADMMALIAGSGNLARANRSRTFSICSQASS